MKYRIRIGHVRLVTSIGICDFCGRVVEPKMRVTTLSKYRGETLIRRKYLCNLCALEGRRFSLLPER